MLSEVAEALWWSAVGFVLLTGSVCAVAAILTMLAANGRFEDDDGDE